jgi:hypothetical protein
MGAHGADKLLKDVQSYHDMHHEIVTQKMHQITPPRTEGKYGEKPCGNPQCSECPKPRHIAVGFSKSRQEATILRGSRQTNGQQNEERSSSPAPSAASSQAAASLQAAANSWIEERSSSQAAADSSPPRQIAALPPPRIVAAPSELFNNDTPDDLIISPHIRKWDPIANGSLDKPPVDNVDYTHMIPGGLNGLLKRQGEQNERAMHNIVRHAGRRKEGQARSKGEDTRTAGGTKKQASIPHAPRSREQTEATSLTCPHTGTDGDPVHVGGVERKGLGRVVQKTHPKLALGVKNHQCCQR